MNINVKDKVAIITGASGLIGGAFADAFAEHGAIVIIANRSDELGIAKAKELTDKGGRAYFYHFDQTDNDNILDVFAKVKERFGRIDIMMNNAGVNIPQSCRKPVKDFLDDKFEWMIDVDLHGLIRCCKGVIPYMLEQGGGCIINTTSVNGTIPLRNQCAFPGAKSAANGVTRALACEYGDKGIRVNAIAPGSTPLVSEAWSKVMSKEQDQTIIRHIPMARQALAKEMAGTALWLASDELSGYVTGQIVNVDGGWTVGINFE